MGELSCRRPVVVAVVVPGDYLSTAVGGRTVNIRAWDVLWKGVDRTRKRRWWGRAMRKAVLTGVRGGRAAICYIPATSSL